MAIKISLLEFFRTGKFGTAAVGMTREEVKMGLGSPDRWWDADKPKTESEAMVWIYGGVELHWFNRESSFPLSLITFKPHYLYWRKYKTEIDRWVFRTQKGPRRRRLKIEFDQEAIPYQDTGFDVVVSHSNVQDGTNSYEVIPFDKITQREPGDEVFGTLVLKSGVQVRYLENNFIATIAIPGDWGFKGREQLVKW